MAARMTPDETIWRPRSAQCAFSKHREARAQTSPANGSFYRRGASPHRAFRLSHTRGRCAVLIATMASAVQLSGEGGLRAKFSDCLFRANRSVILVRYGKFTTRDRLSSG
jgi:hypothetical protein